MNFLRSIFPFVAFTCTESSSVNPLSLLANSGTSTLGPLKSSCAIISCPGACSGVLSSAIISLVCAFFRFSLRLLVSSYR